MTKEVIGKVIYIPTTYDKSHGYPEIIYVQDYRDTYVAGSTVESEVGEGRRRLYHNTRCIPYTAEQWLPCEEHIAARDALAAAYKKLENLARRTPVPT